MIKINTMQGEEMYVNDDHIELIKSTPDTILVLQNEKRIIVTDTAEEIVQRIVEFRKRVLSGDLTQEQ